MKRTALVLGKVRDAGLGRLRSHSFQVIGRPDNPAALFSVVTLAAGGSLDRDLVVNGEVLADASPCWSQ